MRRYLTSVALVACAVGMGSRAVYAQSAVNLFADAIRAYGNLDFELAAGLLRRDLGRLSTKDAPSAEHAKALWYLGASDVFRGRRDSARAVFRRLVMLDPRYRPDRLIFPPEVTGLFDGVRRDTKALAIAVPRETELAVGEGSFSMWLVASSFQTVEVTLRYTDGAPLRSLYTGPIGDSLKVQWDGLDAAGGIPPVERVLMRIASRTPSGELVGIRQLPLEIRALRGDTLAWPAAPAPAQLLPERTASGPAVRALMGGALVSAVVLALPAVVGGADAPSGPRVAVAGTVSLAGILGYVLHRPGRPLAANIRANEGVRQAWRERVAGVEAENARRVRAVRLAIRAGEPTVIYAGAP